MSHALNRKRTALKTTHHMDVDRRLEEKIFKENLCLHNQEKNKLTDQKPAVSPEGGINLITCITPKFHLFILLEPRLANTIGLSL